MGSAPEQSHPRRSEIRRNRGELRIAFDVEEPKRLPKARPLISAIRLFGARRARPCLILAREVLFHNNARSGHREVESWLSGFRPQSMGLDFASGVPGLSRDRGWNSRVGEANSFPVSEIRRLELLDGEPVHHHQVSRACRFRTGEQSRGGCHALETRFQFVAVVLVPVDDHHDTPIFWNPARVSEESRWEPLEQLVLALARVHLEREPAQDSRKDYAERRLHRGLLDEELDVFDTHDLPRRAGAPERTSGSPTPNRPSSHRCPREAPAAMNSGMPRISSARTVCE